MLGVAATRVDARLQAALGQGTVNPVEFESCQSLEYGGVLFLLPFLLVNGLLSYKNHFSYRTSGYYDFDTIILLLSFMYLCRITSVEQLKHYSPGEFGKLLGLDRIPEARCLRSIIKELTAQKKSAEWNSELAREWIKENDTGLYYIDGHIKVYDGYLANLGKKFVSRQKLCLPGITEFWVNNSDGLPYFFITGQVNEKLQQAIEEQIIPDLNKLTNIKQEDLDKDADLPRYTIVFDREAYSPVFFQSLWETHRVAVITYRKNVKDSWPQEDFRDHQIETDLGPVTMSLSEKPVELNDVKMREIRKLSLDGHQTSVITTNKKLSKGLVALYMFSRWSQENFFRYMRQEYDLDRIIQYGVDQLDDSTKVVNPEYSNLCYHIKKTREKIVRKQARLFILQEENLGVELEKTNLKKQLEVQAQLEELEKIKNQYVEERKKHDSKITIDKMDANKRYNKLKTESKHLQNLIKMICYRAETAFANLLALEFKKKTNEIRALVKSIIFSKADLKPDYKEQTLTVSLYSLSTTRENKAVERICQTLNETETLFPGTELKLIFKSTTI